VIAQHARVQRVASCRRQRLGWKHAPKLHATPRHVALLMHSRPSLCAVFIKMRQTTPAGRRPGPCVAATERYRHRYRLGPSVEMGKTITARVMFGSANPFGSKIGVYVFLHCKGRLKMADLS